MTKRPDVSEWRYVMYEGKKYYPNSEAYLSNRVFPGCFIEVAEGEDYISEWEERAKDEDGNDVVLRWQFDLVKGDEGEDDCLPWEDESKIVEVIDL